MAFYKSIIVALGLAALPFAAQAAPIALDEYYAVDYNGQRSIWTDGGQKTNDSRAFVNGGGASALWSFSDDSKFNYTAGGATLTGTATNTGVGVTDLSFDFSLDFTVSNSGNTPYCQQSGAGGMHDCSLTDAGIDPTDWTYFTMTSGLFTGSIGSALEGLTYTLTSDEKHNPQAGEAANALDETGLGFSMWFTWERSGMAVNGNPNNYTFNTSGRGDINIDIVPTPLPAGGLLLLAGLGGLSFLRRKKR